MRSGGKAFIYAALCPQKSAEIFAVLKEKSTIDFKVATFDGDTPLHYAAYCGNVELAEALIKNGAYLMARNDEGNTPIQVAIKQNKEETVEVIESYMSDDDKALILSELNAAQDSDDDDEDDEDDDTSDQNPRTIQTLFQIPFVTALKPYAPMPTIPSFNITLKKAQRRILFMKMATLLMLKKMLLKP